MDASAWLEKEGDLHSSPIAKNTASMLREVILPLCVALVRCLECWVLVWAPQYTRDIDILECIRNHLRVPLLDSLQ